MKSAKYSFLHTLKQKKEAVLKSFFLRGRFVKNAPTQHTLKSD